MKGFPFAIQDRLRAAVRDLAREPRPPGVKKLVGAGSYRIRVGDHRVIFSIDDRSHTIVIEAARHRKDAYR